ncbi:DnaJ like chaperone protein [Methylomarinovum tepidoasis]|uniref:Co-chaperone protein DjlA n=1 Tax=Methylomarinovum tepidoasis TaxID=2840183 RepID=A0AAU9CTG5_9GAMM|nr:co-chaperone DjlA [Methylomarinovum sp. IN45]BCX87895.1 DnaJ like chaperone protein [Methylomarinovum sp. IN45]
MSWLGKVLGGTFGFMLGGPLGALLGAAVGHQFDRGLGEFQSLPRMDAGQQERIQMAFFTATFSVMGHLAKADGRVTEEEIAVARQIMDRMDLPPHLRETAIRLFREGKSPNFPLDATLDQFRQEVGRRASLIRLFLEIQLQAAYADGRLHPTEERLLLHICQRLGFSRFEFQALRAFIEAQLRFTQAYAQHQYQQRHGHRPPPRRQQPSLSDAYALLGVSPDASDAEIKKAYRRLMSQHHPDKLVAKGLPEEMVRIATEKTQKIREAYEIIRNHRQHR